MTSSGQLLGIVFEGGGVKGIGHIGALKELKRRNQLTSIKRFAGTSIGAIIASCMAMGLDPDLLETEIMNVDLNTLREHEWPWRKLYNLITGGGLFRMRNLRRWLETLIVKANCPKDITLKQLYDQTENELVVATCRLNKMEPVYLHHATSPDLTVLDAMCMSASFPMYYTLLRYKGDKYCDGGLTDNYPFWVFNDMSKLYNGDWSSIPKYWMDSSTLGLKVLAPHESNTVQLYSGNVMVNSIVQTISALINTMCIQLERDRISQTYITNTIGIHTANVTALDFNISEMSKKFLIAAGETAAACHTEKCAGIVHDYV